MTYKYKLSVCVCIKNEGAYIFEFIKHYINQGIDHFYIINNNSNDNIEELIHNSMYDSLITLLKDDRCIDIADGYSTTNGITGVLNYNLYALIKNETEWAIVVDIDEFMYGKNGYNIKTFLETVSEDIGCIYVIWNIMTLTTIDIENTNSFSINSNNFKRLNYDLIHELSWDIKNANDFGKSIFKTSMLNGQIGLHKTHQITGKIINNYGENKNSWYDNYNNIEYSEKKFKDINISLNHYVIRNSEDYNKKKQSFELNIQERNALLKGVFELYHLDDMYFIFDNEIEIY
jgi:hypothetical protein